MGSDFPEPVKVKRRWELRGLLTGWTIIEDGPSPSYAEEGLFGPYIRLVLCGRVPSVIDPEGKSTSLRSDIHVLKADFERDPIGWVQMLVRSFMRHEADEALFLNGKQVEDPHKHE